MGRIHDINAARARLAVSEYVPDEPVSEKRIARMAFDSTMRQPISAHNLAQILSKLPNDAMIVRVEDKDYMNTTVLYIRSKQFPETEPGDYAPKIVIQYQQISLPNGDRRHDAVGIILPDGSIPTN